MLTAIDYVALWVLITGGSLTWIGYKILKHD